MTDSIGDAPVNLLSGRRWHAAMLGGGNVRTCVLAYRAAARGCRDHLRPLYPGGAMRRMAEVSGRSSNPEPARWVGRRHRANVRMAEGEGFEPPEPFGSTVFKTAAFDHSATPPRTPPQIEALPGNNQGIRCSIRGHGCCDGGSVAEAAAAEAANRDAISWHCSVQLVCLDGLSAACLP